MVVAPQFHNELNRGLWIKIIFHASGFEVILSEESHAIDPWISQRWEILDSDPSIPVGGCVCQESTIPILHPLQSNLNAASRPSRSCIQDVG